MSCTATTSPKATDSWPEATFSETVSPNNSLNLRVSSAEFLSQEKKRTHSEITHTHTLYGLVSLLLGEDESPWRQVVISGTWVNESWRQTTDLKDQIWPKRTLEKFVLTQQRNRQKFLSKEGMDSALLLEAGFGHLLCSPYFLYESPHLTKKMCWSRLKQDCDFSSPVSMFREKNHICFLLWTYFGNLSVSSQCRKNTVFREGCRLHDPSLCPSFLVSRVFWRGCRCLRKTEAKLHPSLRVSRTSHLGLRASRLPTPKLQQSQTWEPQTRANPRFAPHLGGYG